MSSISSSQRAMKVEFIKLVSISLAIVTGGLILASFVPSRDILKWRDLGYYSVLGFILLAGQIALFLSRRKYYLSVSETEPLENDLSTIPTSATISRNTNPSSSSRSNSKIPKEAVQIDETAVSYCPSCGRSFTSKYKFCPSCGSCKISSY